MRVQCVMGLAGQGGLGGVGWLCGPMAHVPLGGSTEGARQSWCPARHQGGSSSVAMLPVAEWIIRSIRGGVIVNSSIMSGLGVVIEGQSQSVPGDVIGDTNTRSVLGDVIGCASTKTVQGYVISCASTKSVLRDVISDANERLAFFFIYEVTRIIYKTLKVALFVYKCTFYL